jgi:chromosome segregation ATPase
MNLNDVEAERDRLRDELAEANARRGDLRTALQWANEERDRLQRERDEARAEVDHWRVKAEAYGNMVFGCGPVLEAAGHPIDCSLPGGKVKGVRIAVEALVLERDDARSLLLQARDAVEHERDRLSDCEHDPAFCTCDEAAKASALLAKIDALNADRSEVRRLRAFERAEVERLMRQLADATNESTHFQVMCKRETEEVERLARQVELLTDERDELLVRVANQDAELRATREAYLLALADITSSLPIPEEP